MAGSEGGNKATKLMIEQNQDQEDQNQTVYERRRKLPPKLPNSNTSPKVANITRPAISLNCETSARKRKLKRGFQSKPRDKTVVKNKVSKSEQLYSLSRF